jgi:hypothetical protein
VEHLLEAAKRAAEYGAALQASELNARMERSILKESRRKEKHSRRVSVDSAGEPSSGYISGDSLIGAVDETGAEREPDSDFSDQD